MFTQLASMLKPEGALMISVVAAKDGPLTLTVTPKGDFKGREALGSGLTLTGTPEELDRELPELLAKYVSRRQTLAEQIEASLAVIEQAASEKSKAASKAVGSAAKAAAPAAAKTEAAKPAAAAKAAAPAPAPAAAKAEAAATADSGDSWF